MMLTQAEKRAPELTTNDARGHHHHSWQVNPCADEYTCACGLTILGASLCELKDPEAFEPEGHVARVLDGITVAKWAARK